MKHRSLIDLPPEYHGIRKKSWVPVRGYRSTVDDPPLDQLMQLAKKRKTRVSATKKAK